MVFGEEELDHTVVVCNDAFHNQSIGFENHKGSFESLQPQGPAPLCLVGLHKNKMYCAITLQVQVSKTEVRKADETS